VIFLVLERRPDVDDRPLAFLRVIEDLVDGEDAWRLQSAFMQ
jgi:hypothetical protein